MWSIINGPGHMRKMAARAINSKNLSKSFSPEPVDRVQRNLICSSGDIWSHRLR